MPRPPKNIRDALREAGEWVVQPSPPPFDPVAAFCASVDDTLPMPGAFEAIAEFTSGPPPHATFVNGPLFGDMPELVSDSFNHLLPGAGVFQTMGLDGDMVSDRLFSAAHVAAAFQMSKAHVSTGHRDTVLTPLCNEQLPLPGFLSSYIEGIGELEGPDGRQWLYADVESEMRAAVRAADQLLKDKGVGSVAANYWLPTQLDDDRCRFFLAYEIHQYLRDRGVHLPISELDDKVFSGSIPPALAVVAHSLPPEELLPLKEFFQTYSTEGEFLRRFSSARGTRALSLLGISWDNPDRDHLHFQMNLRNTVIVIRSYWQAVWQTYASALDVTFRPPSLARTGDKSQFCRVTPQPGGVKVSSYYTPNNMSSSYRACFGSPVHCTSMPDRSHCLGLIHPKSYLVSILRHDLGL